MTSASRKKLAAALSHASRGWPVAPAWEISPSGYCACKKKKDCQSPGKHPILTGGYKIATIEKKTIEERWKIYPTANILVATGVVSGFDVLDIDPRHGGGQSPAGFDTAIW